MLTWALDRHQQQRCNKTVYDRRKSPRGGNAVWHPLHPHRTDESNSTTKDNTMTSNSLKAQGKGVMHPVLTEVSLRSCYAAPVNF